MIMSVLWYVTTYSNIFSIILHKYYENAKYGGMSL
jgi:hypothetical protein